MSLKDFFLRTIEVGLGSLRGLISLSDFSNRLGFNV